MDDDVMVARTVRRMLTSKGYQVTVAHDGGEAIEVYRDRMDAEPFDVVILDLTVPGGMGGAETISRLRKLDPNVRAIVSSGYSSDPVVANYRDYGFRAVASKPYNVNTIVHAVKAVLDDTESSPA
jgi:CheY-like chemotaxis protein